MRALNLNAFEAGNMKNITNKAQLIGRIIDTEFFKGNYGKSMPRTIERINRNKVGVQKLSNIKIKFYLFLVT